MEAYLERLLLSLTDMTPHEESMWALLHLIEKVDHVKLVAGFVGVFPRLARSAPEWADTIVCRMINSAQVNPILADAARIAPAGVRAELRRILEAVVADNDPPRTAATAAAFMRDTGI